MKKYTKSQLFGLLNKLKPLFDSRSFFLDFKEDNFDYIGSNETIDRNLDIAALYGSDDSDDGLLLMGDLGLTLIPPGYQNHGGGRTECLTKFQLDSDIEAIVERSIEVWNEQFLVTYVMES